MEQPGSLRIAIDREQSRGLRPFQHLTATLARRVQDGRHLEDECVSFDGGAAAAGVSVQYGSAPPELLPPLSACRFSEILLTVFCPVS